MSEQERYLAAIDKVHEAALHPKGWPEFLGAFNALLNGWVGQYMVWDEATQTNAKRHAVHGISDAASIVQVG